MESVPNWKKKKKSTETQKMKIPNNNSGRI